MHRNLYEIVKTWMKVLLKVSLHISVPNQNFGMKIHEIKKNSPENPTHSISYHATRTVNDETNDHQQ